MSPGGARASRARISTRSARCTRSEETGLAAEPIALRCGPGGCMDIAWRPTEWYLGRSRLRRFAEQHGHCDFASLYRWSVEDLEGFWRAVDRDLGLGWQAPYERVLDTSRGVPWTTWWVDGRMNYVATALRHDPSRAALVFEGEEGATRRLTYGELASAVRRFAAGLRAPGG